MVNQIEIYQSSDGQTTIDVKFGHDTIWLNQKQIASLFGTEIPAINKHIKNIYKDGELNADLTISNLEIVQIKGVRRVNRKTEVYNLDLILSIGYIPAKQRSFGNDLINSKDCQAKNYPIIGLTLNITS